MSAFDESAKGGAPEETEEEMDIKQSLANSDVTTKYQEAAKIANATLLEVIGLCVPGALIVEICKTGDKSVLERLKGCYNKKGKDGNPVEKGLAFPVCISVNEIICHCSPLESEASTFKPLAAGDFVKIDLGCHIDGYIAVVAHTIIVGDDAATKVEGPRANVLQGAYTAAQAALRMIRPGNTNEQVTAALKKIAENYNVQPIVGTMMHNLKRFIIDGNKIIYVREEEGTATTKPIKQELVTFEANEVYAVDVAFSTGDGRPKEKDIRTTVFKRVADAKYMLKSASSRAFYGDLCKKIEFFPFSLRNFEDERQAKMGIVECRTHNLVQGYPVVAEKDGDHVAHFKFTVLVLPSGNSRVTGLELPANIDNTLFETLPEDVKAILAIEEGNKKKKKAAAKAAAGGEAPKTAAP